MHGPKFLETEVDKYDIRLYINKVDTMSDDDKFMLISNVWQPPPHFVYPTTDDWRFNSDWFKIFAGGCAIQNTLMEHSVWHVYFLEIL